MRSIRLPLTLVLLATLSFASEPATAQTAPSDDEAFVVEIVEPIDLAAYPTVGVPPIQRSASLFGRLTRPSSLSRI